MFDCLAWPSHACSINQLRGCRTIFDDRIDLTLLDIQKFYNLIKGKSFSVELINAIEKHCCLSMAYLNAKTFAWLCSFSDFDDFIRRNGPCLEYFVTEENGKYVAKYWTNNEEKRFNEKYFFELCKKVEKYKAEKNQNIC